MNPIILSLAMGKQWGRLGSLVLFRQPVKEKENSESCLKNELVLHLASDGGVGLIHISFLVKILMFEEQQ